MKAGSVSDLVYRETMVECRLTGEIGLVLGDQ